VAGQLAASADDALAPIPANLTAAEVMSRDVSSVAPGAPLREVVETMLVKGRRDILVLEAGRVAGIITNGDLVQRGGLGGRLQLLRGLAWTDVQAQLEGLAGAAKTAADVMTPAPVTVAASTPLRRVAEMMAFKKLKRLPVVDEGGGLLGIVSRIDLLRAAVGRARPGDEAVTLAAPGGTQVARVMRTEAPTVLATASLSEVLQAVVSTRLNKALVVDRDRRVLGLITDAELMDRMTPAMRPGLLRSLMKRLPFAQAEEPHGRAPNHARAKNAADLMVAGVPQVTPETPLSKAISVMLESDRKILAVVDGAGRLQGIVDRADLLRGIAAVTSGGDDPAEPGSGVSSGA
jgi:CBS-domain-containing membrane protein